MAENGGHAALAAVGADWNRGAEHWNADALAAVYADDALFFGGRPGHQVGRASIREYFASYEGVILSASLELVDQQVAELAPDLVVAQGYGHFSFVLAGDTPTRSVLRTTLLIERRGDRWRIRQHHFSMSPAVPPLGQS